MECFRSGGFWHRLGYACVAENAAGARAFIVQLLRSTNIHILSGVHRGAWGGAASDRRNRGVAGRRDNDYSHAGRPRPDSARAAQKRARHAPACLALSFLHQTARCASLSFHGNETGGGLFFYRRGFGRNYFVLIRELVFDPATPQKIPETPP